MTFVVDLGLRGATHVFDPQLFRDNQADARHELCGQLVIKVVALPRDLTMHGAQARATFNRILIATQASVMAWSLMWNTSEDAARTRSFLVRLSGRQMKRTRPVTFPALLDGLFKLLTMLETLEHYSISELKEFALIAKNQIHL
jgi:hypothetical protein